MNFHSSKFIERRIIIVVKKQNCREMVDLDEGNEAF